MFVDVGTNKDGLVHVKDVSNSYFIENIESKFSPGQDIDVWVKFVDIKANKFGLQMYPLLSQPFSSAAALDPKFLAVKQEIEGIAVKYSDYGIYVDIGLTNGNLAYLHKRKIKLTKR